ncbi:MAG: NOP5/NOP56 family protein [Halococcoides sp.]
MTGWFENCDPGDADSLAEAIRAGGADEPRDWPTIAVESGFAADRDAYYDRLHEATVAAADRAVAERERADDRRIVHQVRALDDCRRTANELAERVSEWAGAALGEREAGIEYAREIAERDDVGESLRQLARRVADLDDEADALEADLERSVPAVAPNLAGLAGPILAARLIALAGGLKDLARKPSGTVQVLGAEDALFAHLRGSAPSPKHGVIYTHDAVSGTRPGKRGSAARALAGKLSIAARIDHYSGDRRPDLERDLDERIAQIRSGGAQ